MYLESFGNPRRFAKLARRIGRAQADRRRQERAEHGRASRGDVAHGRAARRLGLHRGRALPPERRDPHRYARASCSTWRRCWRTNPCRPATASRSSRTPEAWGSCVRTRAKSHGLVVPELDAATVARAALVPPGRLIRVEPRRHDRLGRGRGLRPHDPGGVCRSGHRRVDRDLHPSPRGGGVRGRPSARRRHRRRSRADPGAVVLHVDARSSRGSAIARRPHPLLSLSRTSRDRAGACGAIRRVAGTSGRNGAGVRRCARGRGGGVDRRRARPRGGMAPDGGGRTTARLLRGRDGADGQGRHPRGGGDRGDVVRRAGRAEGDRPVAQDGVRSRADRRVTRATCSRKRRR